VDFAESDEHRDLRAAVGAIASRFGGAYYVERPPHTSRAPSCGSPGLAAVPLPVDAMLPERQCPRP
jgi:hypothetical protein